jgi:hypothetical protein
MVQVVDDDDEDYYGSRPKHLHAGCETGIGKRGGTKNTEGIYRLVDISSFSPLEQCNKNSSVRILLPLAVLAKLPASNGHIPLLTEVSWHSLQLALNHVILLLCNLRPLLPDQFKIVREEPVSCDRTVVGASGEGTDNARADEDGEVETVLGVPFGSFEAHY